MCQRARARIIDKKMLRSLPAAYAYLELRRTLRHTSTPDIYTVFHAKRVECAMFHLLVNISGILHARPTYDISSRSPIFGDHFHTNDKVSHDSHVTQLAEEVTRF